MSEHVVYIGLGSNLGEPEANLNAALEMLAKHPGIADVQSSSFYETKPLGRLDQPLFLNAAARISTRLSPRDLFGLFQQIERELGRETNERWEPRTIDLDLLLFEDMMINEPDLVVPHSQMHLRSFVLKGMCELSPELPRALDGETE